MKYFSYDLADHLLKRLLECIHVALEICSSFCLGVRINLGVFECGNDECKSYMCHSFI